MSNVTNCDGTSFVPADDPGRCKHGIYVGGCGYDLMCHWCEMGEEPYVPTARDHWTAFCGVMKQIRNLNRIMVEESLYPYDPEAWSSIMGADATRQMEVAVRQALLPTALRALEKYGSATRYCRSEQFPGDPESPECELERWDSHESGVHMRFDATGGVSAEWDA